jgi:tetratricopeptide (TPR) repeat protein
MVAHVRRASFAARLPALPDLSAEPAAVRAHLLELDRAARADAASADAVGALGMAYHADGFYDPADECYALAEELKPRVWQWGYYRALAEAERGRTENALVSLQRVVAFAPDYGPAWLQLGDAAFKVARDDVAQDAWRRAQAAPEPSASSASPAHVTAAPIAAYAALGLARIALKRGIPDTARQLLEPVTTTSPQFGPAFRVLGEAYGALGRTSDAARAVHRADALPAYAPPSDPMVDALSRGSRNSTVLLQQASVADPTRNTPWREYLISRALEFDPDNPDVVYEMGVILHQSGRNDEALRYFRRYQQMVPGEYRGLTEIGKCLSDLRRFAEAESALRQALQGTDDATAHFNLGYVLDQEARLDDSIAEYEQALVVNPNHIGARTNLAAAFARAGRLPEAVRQLEQALDTDPDNADVHANLGTILAVQGDDAGAVRELREALRINPQHAAAQNGLRLVQAK